MTGQLKHLSLFFTVITVLFSVNAKANSEEGKFNAGEVILHHVQDAHEIHIAGDFAIPLPIILIDGGMKFFSSGSFYHSEAMEIFNPKTKKKEHYFLHEGYILYHEKIYKLDGKKLELDEEGHPHNAAAVTDLSITKNVAGLLLIAGFMLWLFFKIAKSYTANKGKAPSGAQSFFEPLIMFLRDDVAKPSIGHHFERFMPFLLTLFFFILFSNLLGLIPFLGGINVTGNIAVTLVLALLTFIITSINANKAYWMHIVAPPGVPLWLLPIMIPIEILGVFSKPFVLMLRLFANVTAGHIIILAFVGLIFIFNDKYGAAGGLGVSVVSTAFAIFMNCLELLVAFLQAYVFTLLAALYFGSATEEAHH
jgi:F-type H+-transporting ATPase subunit a